MADVVQQFDNMVGHIVSINDERDVIPLLLGLKELWPKVLDELRSHGANRYWEGSDKWPDMVERIDKACHEMIDARDAEIERLRGLSSLGEIRRLRELELKQRDEIERLRDALATCRELRQYDAKTIKDLRSGNSNNSA